jgi:hypothetical protein
MRTAQELFETVVNHLRKQNEKSHKLIDDKNYACLYRSDTGMKCAVGCLIPDDKYSPNMEEKNLYALVYNKENEGVLPSDLKAEFLNHFKLLSDLQTLHDNSKIQNWESGFVTLANRYSVKLP